MEPSVKGERFLIDELVSTIRLDTIKDQVPAVARDSTGNQDKVVVCQELIAKSLLPRSWNSGKKPVWIRNIRWLDNVNR